MLSKRNVTITDEEVVIHQLSGLDYIDFMDYLTESEIPEEPVFNLSDKPTDEEQSRANKTLQMYRNKVNRVIFLNQSRLVAYGVYRNQPLFDMFNSENDPRKGLDKVHEYVMRHYCNGTDMAKLHDEICRLSGMPTRDEMEQNENEAKESIAVDRKPS